MYSLAALYYNQKKFDEAESFFAQVLADRRKDLAAEFTDTLLTAWYTANVRKQEKKHCTKRQRDCISVIGLEVKIGPDRPDTRRLVQTRKIKPRFMRSKL